MKLPRRLLSNKKGINTILAALLMVVIVVVASVMVYAWSTGLLSSLLVQNPVPKESIQYDNFAYASGSPVTNLTVYIRNSGSVQVALQTYYVKDANGNQYTVGSLSPQPTITPNAVAGVNFLIAGNCPSGCTYSNGAPSGGFQYVSGNSYTVTVVTTRNNQFTWSFTK
jgi:FlaG/FlaF family flagellin (archaellin)